MMVIKDLEELKKSVSLKIYDLNAPLFPRFEFRESNDCGNGCLYDKETKETYNFADRGFSDLAKALGASSKFFSSLDTKLRSSVINTRIRDSAADNNNAWVRMVTDENNSHSIRALINRNWSKFDNIEVINLALPFCDSYGLRLDSASLDDSAMDLRLVFDDEVGTEDDIAKVGVSIFNDECSIHPLTVDLFVWRQVCTNGMIIRYKSRKLGTIPHKSIDSEVFASILDNSLTKTYPYVRNIGDAFYSLRDFSIRDIVNDETLEKWRKLYGIPKSILKELPESSMTDYFQVINSITRQARVQEVFGTQRKGEIAAGNLLLDVLADANTDVKFFNTIFSKHTKRDEAIA